MSDQLRRRNRLTVESLRELATGEIDLIWHRAYYPPRQCDAALPAVVKTVEDATFLLTKEFTSVGTSMEEVANGGESVRRYLDAAAATTRLIRHDVFGGQQSPTDLIRLDLDEMWPHGAMVGRHEGPDDAARRAASDDRYLMSSGSEPSGRLLVVGSRRWTSTRVAWTLSPAERSCRCWSVWRVDR